MPQLRVNDGMYCGEVADIIQPLFPIGMKIPKSIRLPPCGTYDDCVFFRGRTAGVSAAQPDNGACAGYQASTQLHPVVIEARSAEMTTGRSPGR